MQNRLIVRTGFMKFVGGIAFVLLVNLGQSHAATLFSNLTDAVNGTGGIYTGARPQAYGQEFNIGSHSAALGSIIVPLGLAQPSFTPAAELVVDNGGRPGTTVLTTFPVPSIPTLSPSNVTFTPTSSVMLGANTNYWFILSATGTGTFRWNYTDTVSPFVPSYASSHDLGATWSTEDGGPFLIEIDSPSTPTPEPSSLLLVGFVSVLGFAAVVSRRVKTPVTN